MANDHSEGTRNVGKSVPKAAPVHSASIGHNSAPKKHKLKFRTRHAEFDSTCLASATYDPNTETLYDVVFQDGRGPYEYEGVDLDTWKELKDGATGTVFNEEVR